MNPDNIWVALSIFSPLLPLFATGWRWRALSSPQRMLLVWVVFEMIFDVVGRKMGEAYINNNPVMYIYVTAETLILLRIFQASFKEFLGKYTLTILMAAFVGFVLTNGFVWQSFTAYASNLRLAESVVLSGLSLVWFYMVFRQQQVDRLERSFSFWMAVGLLLYFSSNMILWAFGDLGGEQDHAYFVKVWTVHAVSNIVLHLIYTLALCMNDRT